MQFAFKCCCLSLLIFLILFRTGITFTKLTNIECKAFDKSFAEFQKCRLTVPKRGRIALSIHVKLFKLPVNNVTINLSFFKKASGYRPFLYNITTDFCAFMANRARSPFLKLFFDILLRESNINHTCPYDHDIIVKNLVMQDGMFSRFPVPAGEYMFKLKVGAYNDWKADVKGYLAIRLEDKN